MFIHYKNSSVINLNNCSGIGVSAGNRITFITLNSEPLYWSNKDEMKKVYKLIQEKYSINIENNNIIKIS